MHVRRPWLLVILLLVFFPGSARADDHTASAYAGASPIPGSLLIGPHFVFTKPIEGALDKSLSIVLDLSLNFGTDDDDGKRIIYGGGLGWSFVKGDNHPKFVNTVHGLLAGVNRDDAPGSRNKFAGVIGYQLEYLPNRPNSEEGWGVRGQVDRILQQDDEDYWRFSFGVVYRWSRQAKTTK
jgi:hypothetical protein